MAAKTSRAEFEKIFPSLVEDLTELAQKYQVPSHALEWFHKVCDSLLKRSWAWD